jgi:hypothetical protein
MSGAKREVFVWKDLHYAFREFIITSQLLLCAPEAIPLECIFAKMVFVI